MRKSRFSESQIVEILKEGNVGVPVADPLRKHVISRATYFKWKGKYGGASVPELQRLKEQEAENARLKRLHAEMAPENAAIKDVLSRKL
jgi:putative transposase